MAHRLIFHLIKITAFIICCFNNFSLDAVYASTKSFGMGGACISYPIDSLSAAYNPAACGDLTDRLDVEAAWIHDTGSATISKSLILPLNGHYKGMKTKSIYPVSLGLNKIFQLNSEWRLAAGFVLYNRSYQKTTYSRSIVLFGTSKPGIEYLQETAAPTLAINWRNRHSLGVSLDYQFQRLKVNGLQNFDHTSLPVVPGGSISPNHVTNRGYQYGQGLTYTIGYRGQLLDRLSLGFTYQPKTRISKMHKYKGFLANGRLDSPAKISGGISYHFDCQLVLAFDMEWLQWSKVRALSNNLLHQGQLELLGTQNGPGFGFQDQMFYRLGVDWRINEIWAVRAGVRYAQAPAKRSQTSVNILLLDTVETFLTTGATWFINPCNEISVLFAYGLENKQASKNSIPEFLGGGDVAIKEQKWALGLSWGRLF